MPTYRNLDNVPDGKDVKQDNIFRQLQKWVNGISFFNKEINTNVDDRVLTGKEHDPKAVGGPDFRETSGNFEDRVNRYDLDRMSKFKEFENMEFVTEVSSSLDLIADECVQYDSQGHVIHIDSEDGEIVEELETLFFETLRIDNDVWDKFRTMIMYGERFEEIIINKKEPGILYLNYIDPTTIERVEKKGRLVHFIKVKGTTQDIRSMTRYADAFAKEQKSLQPFRVVHYRIEDSRSIPYGRSVLESVRKAVRQINLMEDAMLTYRYSRASEKRVWNIDCGDLGPEESMNYTMQIRDKLRKKPKLNATTGQLDYEMDPLTITEDFFMPIRTGMTNNSVTTLPAGQNLGEIGDVSYFKKKLMFGLKIPLVFIGEEGLSYAKSNLAMIDIRFARFIERIQRFFVKGLEKIAIIHLLLKGFRKDQINNFSIKLTPSSNIKENSQLEGLNVKFAAMGAAKGLEIFPDAWILTELWGASEDEMQNILKMMKIQKAGGDMEGAAGGAGAMPAPEVGGEIGGELPPEALAGEEVPGGEGGAVEPGEETGAGETPGGGEAGAITASYDNMSKNPYIYRLDEDIKKNPNARKEVYAEFIKCMKNLQEQKSGKKRLNKKDKIKNHLREFEIFGELDGIVDRTKKEILTEIQNPGGNGDTQ